MTKATNQNRCLKLLGGLALALTLLPAPAAFAQKPLADVFYSPTTIKWRILQPTNGVALSVAGGDCTFNKDFGRENPFFEARLPDGPLPDGVYRWELRGLQPDIRPIPSGLNNGRDVKPDEKGGGFLNRGNKGFKIIQVGSFTVVRGLILDPLQQEPRPKGAR